MLPNLVFALSSIALLSNAAPVPSNHSTCDPALQLSPSNWECYNVDGFLNSWWSEHGSSCGNQPFFYCFASFYNHTHFLCDGTNLKCNPGQLDDWTNQTEAFYVLVAISNINQYFTNLYNAITTASSITNELLPDLASKLNPPKKPISIWYQEFVATYTNAIFFAKSIISRFPMRAHLIAFSLFNNNLNSKPYDHRYCKFSELSNQLSGLTSNFQNSLADALNATLYNYTIFADFVSNGSFLYGNYAGNSTEEDFKQEFKSYLTDRMINFILRSKNMFAVVLRDFNARNHPGQWDHSHSYWTEPNYKILGRPAYRVWYLTSNSHPTNNYGPIDEVLFEKRPNLTTPEKVFQGSWKCQNETGQIGGGLVSNFDINLPVDVNDCLYNLPVCVLNDQNWSDPNRKIYENCPDQLPEITE